MGSGGYLPSSRAAYSHRGSPSDLRAFGASRPRKRGNHLSSLVYWPLMCLLLRVQIRAGALIDSAAASSSARRTSSRIWSAFAAVRRAASRSTRRRADPYRRAINSYCSARFGNPANERAETRIATTRPRPAARPRGAVEAASPRSRKRLVPNAAVRTALERPSAVCQLRHRDAAALYARSARRHLDSHSDKSSRADCCSATLESCQAGACSGLPSWSTTLERVSGDPESDVANALEDPASVGHSSDSALSSVGRPLPNVSVGDAFDLVGRLMDESIDCIVTSPPYWGLRSYGHSHNESIGDVWASAHPHLKPAQLRSFGPGYQWYRDHGGVLGLEPFPDWYVQHLVEILGRFRPKLKSSGSIWVNLGDTYFARWSSIRPDGRQGLGAGKRSRRRTPAGGYLHDKQLLLVPSRFAIAMQDENWIVRNDLIWAKSAVPPRPEKDRLRLAHEHLFHFVKRSKSGRPSYYYDLSETEPGSKDVVQIGTRPGRNGHSATFPQELVRPRIASSCPPGGLVVDPFCGTGSTLEAAIATGRRAHGMELSTSFAAAARRNVRSTRSLLRESTCD